MIPPESVKEEDWTLVSDDLESFAIGKHRVWRVTVGHVVYSLCDVCGSRQAHRDDIAVDSGWLHISEDETHWVSWEKCQPFTETTVETATTAGEDPYQLNVEGFVIARSTGVGKLEVSVDGVIGTSDRAKSTLGMMTADGGWRLFALVEVSSEGEKQSSF
jgi:hypothetical protein